MIILSLNHTKANKYSAFFVTKTWNVFPSDNKLLELLVNL